MKLTSILKYAKLFSSAKFLNFVSRVGKNLTFLRRSMVLFCCLRDPETPKYVKVVLAAALGYLITPVDLLPDGIPFLGWVDDIAVLTFAFKVANRYIKPSHVEMAKKYIPFGKESMD